MYYQVGVYLGINCDCPEMALSIVYDNSLSLQQLRRDTSMCAHQRPAIDTKMVTANKHENGARHAIDMRKLPRQDSSVSSRDFSSIA